MDANPIADYWGEVARRAGMSVDASIMSGEDVQVGSTVTFTEQGYTQLVNNYQNRIDELVAERDEARVWARYLYQKVQAWECWNGGMKWAVSLALEYLLS